MVQIHQKLLASSARNVPGRSMTPKYITVHNTANASKGADAEMHARYLLNGAGGRQASWHYTVDDKEIYQHLKDDHQGWHAGDGGGKGNTQSIGIEICENADGDFEKAVNNAQWLIKKLMDKHGISIDNVVSHKHWSGKNCPRLLLGQWDSFIRGIGTDEKTVAAPKTQVKSSTTTNKPKASITVDGKWGNSTTKSLQSALGTTQDGIISDQVRNSVTNAFYGSTIDFGNGKKGSMVVKSLQRKIGSNVDGLLGPNTIGRLQLHLGTPHDKKISRPSAVVKELQRRLNAGNF